MSRSETIRDVILADYNTNGEYFNRCQKRKTLVESGCNYNKAVILVHKVVAGHSVIIMKNPAFLLGLP